MVTSAPSRVIPSIDATKYQVQAYDLPDNRLLPGVIADKRQAGWIMAGYPISRTTTRNGDWVYTLYSQTNNYPSIHALDTVRHVAVCVGLPANWTTDSAWISNAHLKLSASTLTVTTKTGKARFLLSTETFRVTTPRTAMRKAIAACIVFAALSAPVASAKDGAQAHLLAPIPPHPRAGALITIRWTVTVPARDGRRTPFGATGMFAVLVGATPHQHVSHCHADATARSA